MTRAIVDHVHLEAVIQAAAIRAELCADRGLSESQACHPPGLDAAQGAQTLCTPSSPATAPRVGAPANCVRSHTWLGETLDTEGGSE